MYAGRRLLYVWENQWWTFETFYYAIIQPIRRISRTGSSKHLPIRIRKNKQNTLASFELDHSSGSGFVNHSVATFLTSDGIAFAQGKAGTTLGTVVFDAQRLGGHMAVSSMWDWCWGTETFSLWWGHNGRTDVEYMNLGTKRFFSVSVSRGVRGVCRQGPREGKIIKEGCLLRGKKGWNLKV